MGLSATEIKEMGNGSSSRELKRPNPPSAQSKEQPAETDTSLALQQAIGDEQAMVQEVINAAQSQGSNLAVKANIAEFTSFAVTNAKLKTEQRKAHQKLIQSSTQATEAIELEMPGDSNFFSSVCDSLTSVSFSLPGQSVSAALPSSSINNTSISNSSSTSEKN